MSVERTAGRVIFVNEADGVACHDSRRARFYEGALMNHIEFETEHRS